MRIPVTAPALALPRHARADLDVRPVTATPVGTIKLARPDALGRTFMSAASGLAAAGGGSAWAVSDEFGDLVRLPSLAEPGVLVPGLPPREKKPDLESVVRLPALDGGAGATMLALGSSSQKLRDRAAVQRVDPSGAAEGAATVVDLDPLYKSLKDHVAQDLNIEGAAWREGSHGAELLLFHRGRFADDHNVAFTLDGPAVLDALRGGKELPPSALRAHQRIDIGSLKGVPLGISDARTLPDGRIAFSASAESAADGPDGSILGSAIGYLDRDLVPTAVRVLDGAPRKVEGLERAADLDPSAPANRFMLVTDPDDPKASTELLSVDLD
jgi:hypothetical protein